MCKVVAIVVGFVCVLCATTSARACATCAAGDPTLTTMGTQQPVAQRLRGSLELQLRRDAVGQPGVNRVSLWEERAAVSMAYAPSDWLMMSLTAPLLMRQVQEVNLARSNVTGVGDIEMRSKLIVYRDRSFMPDHLLALVAGLKAPTGAIATSASGGSLAPELQSGTGSYDPITGLAYVYFGNDFSVFVSEVLYTPIWGRADFRMGPSWRGTHTFQYQATTALAARFSVNTRLDARARWRNPNRIEPDTGGFVGYIAPALVASPASDVVIYLEVQVPVLNALVGRHNEGIIAMVGLAYDV